MSKMQKVNFKFHKRNKIPEKKSSEMKNIQKIREKCPELLLLFSFALLFNRKCHISY